MFVVHTCILWSVHLWALAYLCGIDWANGAVCKIWIYDIQHGSVECCTVCRGCCILCVRVYVCVCMHGCVCVCVHVYVCVCCILLLQYVHQCRCAFHVVKVVYSLRIEFFLHAHCTLLSLGGDLRTKWMPLVAPPLAPPPWLSRDCTRRDLPAGWTPIKGRGFPLGRRWAAAWVQWDSVKLA